MATAITTSSPTAPSPPTAAQLAPIIVDLLAEVMGEDPTQLTQQLQQGGSQMPVDSLFLFEIVASFEERTGIHIPERETRHDTFSSVGSFAQFAADKAGG